MTNFRTVPGLDSMVRDILVESGHVAVVNIHESDISILEDDSLPITLAGGSPIRGFEVVLKMEVTISSVERNEEGIPCEGPRAPPRRKKNAYS